MHVSGVHRFFAAPSFLGAAFLGRARVYLHRAHSVGVHSQVEGGFARTIGFTVSRRSCDLGLAYCFQLSLLTQSRRKLLRCFSDVGLRVRTERPWK